MTVRARFDGKTFVPIDPVDLPKDQIVDLEVRPATELRRGSAELLRQLMRELPPVDKETMEEFRRVLEEGKLPVRDEPTFDDGQDER
jgi:hypothetical protein